MLVNKPQHVCVKTDPFATNWIFCDVIHFKTTKKEHACSIILKIYILLTRRQFLQKYKQICDFWRQMWHNMKQYWRYIMIFLQGILKYTYIYIIRNDFQESIFWIWWFMMTSSNGNIFRVTGPLCGEFTGHLWVSLTKASDAELWCFLWSVPE